jgi:hypothetical protein
LKNNYILIDYEPVQPRNLDSLTGQLTQQVITPYTCLTRLEWRYGRVRLTARKSRNPRLLRCSDSPGGLHQGVEQTLLVGVAGGGELRVPLHRHYPGIAW